jgi:cellulose synthase/poly-beta-1,6-N-acetylglucosamine synthase-like glycosyltransferase
MFIVRILQTALGAVATLWALYLVTMPLLARFRGVTGTLPPAEARTISVIIPSHDMESHIGTCVASIADSDYPMQFVTIYVIADHCHDSTVSRAREAGATVLERRSGPAGKTYALAWAFETLRTTGVDSDMYVVTDATARVHRAFLRELAAASLAGEDIVVAHSIVASDAKKWFAKCLGLTLVHRNLQNWARERMGLSSLIEGRGMAYSRRYIQRHGWRLAVPTETEAGQHPTEDWRHGVRVVEHGYRVAFADQAYVFTPLRGTLGEATRQGIRWERGRQLNAITHGLSLLRTALNTRSRIRLFAALDALQPPVAILGVLCAAIALLAWAWPGPPWVNVASVAPLILVACYGGLVAWRGRHDGIPLSTVIFAPIYLLWRLASFVLAWQPARRR